MSAEPARHVAAASLPVEHVPVAADQSAAGEPRTGVVELGRFAGLEVGVWEMTPGAMTDVEADELFVVIAGAATVEFVDEGRSIGIAPGDVVRLREGQRTLWTVAETLRKVYLTP